MNIISILRKQSPHIAAWLFLAFLFAYLVVGFLVLSGLI